MSGILKCAIILVFCASFMFAKTLMVTMPGALPKNADDYICSRIPLPLFANKPGYVTAFKPIVNKSVHHIILSACNEWIDDEEASRPGPCDGQCKSHILYAWAHNGAPLVLPDGSAFKIGRHSSVQSLLLEVHYSSSLEEPDFASVELMYTTEPQPNRVGIIVLYNDDVEIPPNTQKFPTNISCKLRMEVPIFIIGIRTHAHDLNRGVYGYYFRPGDGRYHLMVKGNAQWPQTFYKPSQLSAGTDSIRLQDGDILMGRCVYDSTSRKAPTSMGSTHADEMCNLYLMYATNSSATQSRVPGTCADDMVPDVWDKAPAESLDYVTDSPPPKADQRSAPNSYSFINFQPNPTWFVRDFDVGKVSGIALADDGGKTLLFVLRRGNNVWDENSFDINNKYIGHNTHYISSPILAVDANSGEIQYKFGNDLFILPHGLSIAKDAKGRPTALWATDVASHKVVKFAWNKWDKPSLILSGKRDAEDDNGPFCQPTDVAVASTGEIFVADGYCNNRVVKFSPSGGYLGEWIVGEIDEMEDFGKANVVVHSITVVPSSNEGAGGMEQICVADRDRALINCYDLNGRLLAGYGGRVLKPSVYAVSFSTAYKLIFGVTGPSVHPQRRKDFQGDGSKVFAFSPFLEANYANTHIIRTKINHHNHLIDLNVQSPHDIEVTQDGSMLFLAQLEDPYLQKIDIVKSDE